MFVKDIKAIKLQENLWGKEWIDNCPSYSSSVQTCQTKLSYTVQTFQNLNMNSIKKNYKYKQKYIITFYSFPFIKKKISILLSLFEKSYLSLELRASKNISKEYIYFSI